MCISFVNMAITEQEGGDSEKDAVALERECKGLEGSAGGRKAEVRAASMCHQ
jgi:hypothetical protein